MANFKGTVFESVRMFAEHQFGPEAHDRLLSELSSADREVLTGANAIAWYPIEPVLRYHHALDRIYGTGDLSLCEQAGRFSASWSMNHVLKVFLRFRSPDWLVERATSVWGRYHDSGRWEIVTDANHPQRIQGSLRDFAVRDRAFCARLCGWLAGAAELTGGKHANVFETHCVCKGADHCSFAISWRK
ncbi:MAG TPA: 4-vinyl reductase [Polyangiales bacterium]|nr:4-vinyl reductase [Polyangiales bacterium]